MKRLFCLAILLPSLALSQVHMSLPWRTIDSLVVASKKKWDSTATKSYLSTFAVDTTRASYWATALRGGASGMNGWYVNGSSLVTDTLRFLTPTSMVFMQSGRTLAMYPDTSAGRIATKTDLTSYLPLHSTADSAQGSYWATSVRGNFIDTSRAAYWSSAIRGNFIDTSRAAYYSTKIRGDTTTSAYYATSLRVMPDSARASYYATSLRAAPDSSRAAYYATSLRVMPDSSRASYYATSLRVMPDSARASYWATSVRGNLIDSSRASYYATSLRVMPDSSRASYWSTRLRGDTTTSAYYATSLRVMPDSSRASYWATSLRAAPDSSRASYWATGLRGTNYTLRRTTPAYTASTTTFLRADSSWQTIAADSARASHQADTSTAAYWSTRIRGDTTTSSYYATKIRGDTTTSAYYATALRKYQTHGTYYAGAGIWITNAENQVASGTQANVSGHIRAFPFFIGKTITIDSINYIVSTAAAGACTIAIYTDSATAGIGVSYPNTRVILGGRDTTSATLKAISLTATPYQFKPGLYWLAVSANNTSTLRSHPTGAVPNVLGYNPSVAATQEYTCWDVTRTYDQYTPSSFPASGTATVAIGPPLIVMRVKSVP